MRKLRVALVLALILSFFASQSVIGQKFAGYTSGFQVQNLSSAQAAVQITYYNQDGSEAGSASDTIAANSSNTYFPVDAPDGVTLDSFNGSIVVSSDQAVAAVVNLLSEDFSASASYLGATQGSTTVSLPLLMKDNSGFDTWYSVQNAGTSAATVNVAYSDGTSASATIEPGAAATFNQADETHNAAVFSAVITSDQPVAAAVVQENANTISSYTGFASGATEPVLPLINANNSGYITGVQLQNSGTETTTVTISYTPSSADLGTACTETQDVAPQSSATFALFAFANGDNSDCAAGELFVGSARVTANSASQPLAAIVNQLQGATLGEAYGSFDPASASDTVVMPLIMDRNNGFFTGFNLINVGTASADVNCSFSGSTVTVSETVAAGASLLNLQQNLIADGYVGSATCTATGGSLLAVVNQLGSSGGDQFLVYEAVAQ